MEELSGNIVCEHPNRNIYQFSGYYQEENYPSSASFPLDAANMLVRGCVLRNTEWAIGVVVYTGSETKSMLNSTTAPSKRSLLERKMGRGIIYLCVLLFILALSTSIGSYYFEEQVHYKEAPFMRSDAPDYDNSTVNSVFQFFSTILVLQVIIPIALYITFEIIKILQVFFIDRDLNLYYAPTDTPMKCRALNINEDLGQIEHIFSDKTGTLTQNMMTFHRCSIAGKKYGAKDVEWETVPQIQPPAEIYSVRHLGLASSSLYASLCGDMFSIDNPRTQTFSTIMNDKKLRLKLKELRSLNGEELATNPWHLFLLMMAACNTVSPSLMVKSNSKRSSSFTGSEEEEKELVYQAESPDESALVEAAKLYDYTLIERGQEYCIVSIFGKPVRYAVHNILPFDNVRKRMSVIISGGEFGDKKVLLCKGADSNVLTNLRDEDEKSVAKQRGHLKQSSSSRLVNLLREDGQEGEEEREGEEGGEAKKSFLKKTVKDIDDFAVDGLRTLAFAFRELPEYEYDPWAKDFHVASNALKGRKEMFSELSEKIEVEMTLVGASAIEDKLQDGVPLAIKKLRESGMKLWVLTGDKRETAVNIAYASHLFYEGIEEVILECNSLEECENDIDSAIATIAKKYHSRRGSVTGEDTLEMRLASRKSSYMPRQNEVALVADGHTLTFALSEEIKHKFLELTELCKVVVCCRVAPIQKAAVVELVKINTKAMTLAIGDGANDVSMIQTAHVGVGISGQEGRQAVMASDFAFAQFRFLTDLLLVHGHWSYFRLANMVLYFLYKNLMFVLVLFWYQIYCGYSAQAQFDQVNLILFSLLYTSIPVIVTAVFDRDVSRETLLQYPQLYELGMKSRLYSEKHFWLMMVDSFWQSLAIFFIGYGTYRNSAIGVFSFGASQFFACLFVVTLQLCLDTFYWNIILPIILGLSVLVGIAACAIIASIPATNYFWWFEFSITQGEFYFSLLAMIVVALAPRYVVQFMSRYYFPTPVDIAREHEHVRRNQTRHEQKVHSRRSSVMTALGDAFYTEA